MRNVIVRSGSSGQSVRELQIALNNRLNPSPNLIINGLFTPQTERAVLAFQRSNWLEMDGIAGPCTLDALCTRPRRSHRQRPLPQPAHADDLLGGDLLTRLSIEPVRMSTLLC